MQQSCKSSNRSKYCSCSKKFQFVALTTGCRISFPSSLQWRIQCGHCSPPHNRSDSNVIQMDTPFNEQSGVFRRLLWLTAEPRQNICAVPWGISLYPLSPALRDLSILLLPLVHTLSINFLSSVQLYIFIIHLSQDSAWKFRPSWSPNHDERRPGAGIGPGKRKVLI